MGLSRCKSKISATANYYFAKINCYTNNFALLDDDNNIVANFKRNLRSNGIYKISLTLLVIICLIGRTSGISRELPDLSQIPTPPSFTHKPNPDTLYYVVEQIGSGGSVASSSDHSRTPHPETNGGLNLKERRFECRATGFPSVTYKWLKNGHEFQLDNALVTDRALRIPGEGTFIFSKLTADDKGVYECLAENGNGTAKDKPINFVQTSIGSLPSRQETLDVEFGEPFKKECIPPPSVPSARASWLLMSGPTAERRLFHTVNFTNVAMNDKGTIFFQYVRESDNIPGFYYTCMAENVELKEYKFGYQFNFNVIRKPNGRQALEPYVLPNPDFSYVSNERITVLQGQSLELFCIHSGYPDKIPTWEKRAGEIDYTRVSYSTNFKKSIKIDHVKIEDEGTYSCRFSTDSSLDRDFIVTVDAAPYWVADHVPANVNSSEGSVVEFVCNAHGRPPPSYTFYKNGIPISESSAPRNKYEISGSRLTIREIKKGEKGQGDNAVYQCKAQNDYGFVWANFYLNILAFRPIILSEPGELETVAGKDVQLKCKVFGSPMPSATWPSVNLMGLRKDIDYKIIPVDSDGTTTLILKNVKANRSGEYSCEFKNIYDSDKAVGKVTVRNATVIAVPLTDRQVTVGKPLAIACNAKHDNNLKVKYTWLANGKVVESDNRIKIDHDENKLIIPNPTGFDSGKYTCVAETDLDNATSTAEITVKDIPPSPTGLTVTCFEDHAELAFYYEEKSSMALPAKKWIVQFTIDEREPDAWDTYVTEITQLTDGRGTARISLFPYGDFAFRVLARNDIGSSLPAYPNKTSGANVVNGRCHTLAAAPIRNPVRVEVEPNTASDLKVNWEPVPRRDWYGPQFQYVVQYKPKDQGDEHYKNKTVEDPHQTSVSIDESEGIQPYKEYDVLVWSKNKEGAATTKPTTVSGRSGESAPGPGAAPTGFMVKSIDGPSSARFSWDPVDKNAVNGEFKGYKIVHWTPSVKRSESNRKEALFDSEATEGAIFDLKPNKKNIAQIFVYNNAGDGPGSDQIEFTMPEGVPTPVQDVSVFPISDDEIGLFWKQPRETNGNLTGYEIKVCPIKDEKVQEAECTTPKEIGPHNLTQARIKGLSTSSPYRVELRGKTDAGYGDPISVETNTTAFFDDVEAKPLVPTVENVQIGHDHVNVSWKPGPYDLGSSVQPPGDRFYIKYRPDGGDQDWATAHEPTGEGLSVKLENLLPSTKYEVKAVSVHKGSETESQSIYFTTAGGQQATSTVGWLIAIIIAIIILVIILIIVCLVVRNRGAKYPVSEKEKEQGREPMLKDEKGFGEYAKPDADEEKRSLTAESKPESETDSMAEYGDGETGRFTEDGSFIGQYGAANKTTAPERGKPNLSTFV